MSWTNVFKEAILCRDLSAIIRPWSDRMGEVSGILASLNAFAYDVIKFFSVQDLVVASKIKMGKKKKKKWKWKREISTNIKKVY